jgi:hypothetical protein
MSANMFLSKKKPDRTTSIDSRFPWFLPGRSKFIGKTGLKRRGVAAVEFAIIAPIFFLFVIGIIEFGRGMMVQQTLTNASREGARQAIVEGAIATDVQTLVSTYLKNASISGATVSVTPTTLETVGFADPVVVSISVPYSSVTWLPNPWFLGDEILEAETTMLGERLQ